MVSHCLHMGKKSKSLLSLPTLLTIWVLTTSLAASYTPTCHLFHQDPTFLTSFHLSKTDGLFCVRTFICALSSAGKALTWAKLQKDLFILAVSVTCSFYPCSHPDPLFLHSIIIPGNYFLTYLSILSLLSLSDFHKDSNWSVLFASTTSCLVQCPMHRVAAQNYLPSIWMIHLQ